MKFEVGRTKIKGGCQLERKVVTNNSKSDLPLVLFCFIVKMEIYKECGKVFSVSAVLKTLSHDMLL